jgi:hypothetical protein
MPYCRKCGAKLADDARFCYNCGTPVTDPVRETPRTSQTRPLRKNPLFIPVMIIIALAISALVITAVASAPLTPVNYNQQNQIGQSSQGKLNLDFQADIGDIYVYTNLTGGSMVLMDVSASGGSSLFGGKEPVTFTVQNSTVNGGEVVTAHVSALHSFPFAGNLHVVCKIYVNPQVDLTLNVHSGVGEVYMDADSDVEISSLTLETTTGNTCLDLQKGAAVTGGLKLSTATGNVKFSMNQANITGDLVFEFNSGTGDIDLNMTQTQKFNGSLQVNGHTGTGDISLNRLLIDGEVAAEIRSNAGLGKINVAMKNFNGNQSPIQSNNYPAASDIDMNFNTGVGNINLNAEYQTVSLPSLRV